MAAMEQPAGTLVYFDSPMGAAASDVFQIEIRGKGCHGAMPSQGIDPLLAAAHILITLQELHARELAMSDEVALTFGSFHAGTAPNAIPDVAVISGTLRTFNEELRAHLKNRIQEILTGVGTALRVKTELTFLSGCPALVNNGALMASITAYAGEILGEDVLRARLGSVVYSCEGVENYRITMPGEDIRVEQAQLPVLTELTVEAMA
jgi:hippurate hydrolase